MQNLDPVRDTLSLAPLEDLSVGGRVGEKIDTAIAARYTSDAAERVILPEAVEAFRRRVDDHLRDGHGFWQGEFWGKWTLSAIAAFRYTGDPRLRQLSAPDELPPAVPPPAVPPPAVPPPGWPQPDGDPADAIEWIKTRPWDTNAWGAGSHAMRVARWLLQWHKEGRIPLQPTVDALNFCYEIQSPETGLWGAPSLPLFNRINGTFKLFPLMRNPLDLPLPHADKIIDQVVSEFYRADYDEKVGACDEWDNWYVLAHAQPHARGHREDEIRKMAAHRVARVVEICTAPDDGLSYFPGRCIQNWIGFDMAPPINQADCMGPALFGPVFSACIEIADLQDVGTRTRTWRMAADKQETPELRARILAGLKIPTHKGTAP